MEWTDFTETEEGTLEEQRLEYKELLGEMAIYEEDLNGAELKHYNDLTTIAWWEHDETEEAERELRFLPSAQTDQETREEEAETSGWVSPTHPAPSPIPLGALRWAGRMGARLPTEWVVLCGDVDLRAVTERAADGRSTLMLERILDPS